MTKNKTCEGLEHRVEAQKQESPGPKRGGGLGNELKKFQVLYELAIAMTADRGLDANLRLVVDKSRELLGADTSYIALRDEARGDVFMHTLSGIRTKAFKEMRIPFGKGLGGLVAKTRRGYIIEDYFVDKHISQVVDEIVADEGVISGMAAPIQMGAKNLGVLYVFNRKRTVFSQSELNALFLIANLAAVEITRKRYEEALRESEEKYRTILETIEEGYYEVDLPGNYTFVNDSLCRTIGHAEDELIGTNARRYTDPENANRLFQMARRVYTTGEPARLFDWAIRAPDGTMRDVECSASLIKDSEGHGIGFRGIIRDVTKKRHMEKELRKAHAELEKRVQERTSELTKINQQLLQEIKERTQAQAELLRAKEAAEAANVAKSNFLANMSHELRTPLNHIIGFTELVATKQSGDLNETQEEYLSDVLQSGEHLLSLINDILDLSKMEAGKHELELTDVNPKILLNNSLIMIKEKALKHRIRLATVIEDIPETIRADERKLKQIMYNLLSNAVKFTPDGGEVSSNARTVDCIVRPGLRQGDPEELKIIEEGIDRSGVVDTKRMKCIKISVSDTGIGIRPEDKGRIFNPFEQVESSRSRRYQGTGMGLSLTKRLIEMHGGNIWVESEGEGKGSAFHFIIPA